MHFFGTRKKVSFFDPHELLNCLTKCPPVMQCLGSIAKGVPAHYLSGQRASEPNMCLESTYDWHYTKLGRLSSSLRKYSLTKLWRRFRKLCVVSWAAVQNSWLDGFSGCSKGVRTLSMWPSKQKERIVGCINDLHSSKTIRWSLLLPCSTTIDHRNDDRKWYFE